MKTTSAPVRVKSFGHGEFETRLGGRKLTAKDVFAERGIEVNGDRIAINGNSATLATPVEEGDQVTAMPWIHGG